MPKTALATANLALFLNECLVYIPRGVNDNRARLGLIILRLEAYQAAGLTILSDVGFTHRIRTSRCCFRTMRVRKIVYPAAMCRI